MVEEAHLVNSRRRTVIFSKKKNQQVEFEEPDSSRSSLFKVQGPKSSEVYGFVGSVSTVVATVVFLIWAYVPDTFLEFIGIHYYPSRYWAMAIPTYLMLTVLLAFAFYIGLNFMSTSTPTSLNNLFDEHTIEAENFVIMTKEREGMPIDSISDIDITRINNLMFNSTSLAK